MMIFSQGETIVCVVCGVTHLCVEEDVTRLPAGTLVHPHDRLEYHDVHERDLLYTLRWAYLPLDGTYRCSEHKLT